MEENNIDQDFPEQEPEQSPEVKPKKTKKIIGRIIYFSLLLIFIGVFVYAAYYLANYAVESGEVSDSYGELSNLVNELRGDGSEGGNGATLPSGSSDEGENNAEDEGGILPEYREVYELNNDLVGWITIPGTVIDYPVVQRTSTTDYYLYRDFYGTYSSWGCLYVREQCDVFTPSDNVVIYGHHMKDGSMFAGLDAYKKKSFWEEHQTFTFDTLYERHTYQVIAVFKTSANVGEGFSYHQFNTAQSEEEFNEFIKTVHSLQMYKTGVTAEYGDMLLTLSTCEYTLQNGRFVVVAKRIS